MSAEVHPAATHHLPSFITPPGQTDVLMVAMAAFLLVAIVALGLVFLRLYALPQQIAHRGQRLQASIVAILCLIALFTQIYGFWIAALVLAFIEIPDFGGWMPRIAAAVERIAERHTEAKPDERTVLSLPDAETQTAGMQRRHERRTGRHDQREERRTGS